MVHNATKTELHTVRREFFTSPYVETRSCQFWSKRKDLHEAEVLTPSVYGQLNLKNIPSSYRCTPQPGDASLLVAQFTGAAGVFSVKAPEATIHAIETTVNWLQLILFLIAVVLMVSASVLILNTIRMAIFARRREVSVMKLVGATNWFIRIPFIAEGLIQGVFGALLASVAVYGIHLTVDNLSGGASPTSLLAEMRLSGWHVLGTDIVVVLVGGAIGALGSAFAVRRFLDV
jgi:cell division transport system permease protein